MLSKVVKLLLVVMCVMALVACKGDKAADGAKAAPEKKIVLKFGCVVAANHPVTMAINQKLKPMIEEGSKGTIEVQVYEGGVLGGEKELYDSVKNGTIDMVTLGTVMWDEFDKMLLPDWPFLYRDVQHAHNVFTGTIGEEIAKEFKEKLNVTLLGWGPNGARTFSSNKAINTVADFKGQRIRMPNNPIHLKLAELLGANVISMNMGDVFGALEQKVVDGQDNPMATVRSSGWYEVQKFIYETNHMVSTLEILASEKFMDSLTDEQQKIVKEAAKAAAEYSWELYMKSIDEDRKFLQDNGLTVVQPTDEDKANMVELMKPLYDDLYAKHEWAVDLTKRIREVK